MEDIILIGGGGHCKSVIDSIRSKNQFNIVGILDTKDNIGKIINEIPVIGEDNYAKELFDKGCKNAFVSVGSIGDNSLRIKLYKSLKSIGYKFPIIIDKTAIVSSNVKVEEGLFVGKGCIINTDVYIGKNSIINSGCIIEHDCIIEDFVHIAPGSVLSGNVRIYENSHIGTNSTIIQNIIIGKNTIIGAGSIVVKNIESNSKAFGNPCKIVKE